MKKEKKKQTLNSSACALVPVRLNLAYPYHWSNKNLVAPPSSLDASFLQSFCTYSTLGSVFFIIILFSTIAWSRRHQNPIRSKVYKSIY